MADVNRIRGRRGKGASSDRGQLILVTGLAVAVTLVALVVLLNTVIYTQNLATRGPQVEDGEAVAFRNEVVEGVGATVDAENRAEYESQQYVTGNVTEAIERYDELGSRYRAERGIVADVNESSVSYTNGSLLRQTNSSRNFTNATGTANWMLVENASDVRAFRMTVSDEQLSDDDSTGFRVNLTSETETWRIYVYKTDSGEIAVSNDDDDSAPDGCKASGPEATIHLTAGTVNGSACSELDYPTEMAAYNVTFKNADKVNGTYSLTVGTPPDDPKVKQPNFADPDATASPRWAYAVYAAEVEIHFETPNLAFHTTVRIAPGEPR